MDLREVIDAAGACTVDKYVATVVRCDVGEPGSLVGTMYWPNQGRTVANGDQYEVSPTACMR
jgi:hypothetical protein